MKILKLVLRKVFKFIFLFWVVISSLFGTYMIADKFFGHTVVAWALIRDFSSASLDLKDFSISARLRATTIGGRSWRDEREPKPDFSDDNSTGAPYELSINFEHVSAPGIVLKNIKLEQVQSGRVVFEKDELEVPIEMGYSGYKSGRLEVPGSRFCARQTQTERRNMRVWWRLHKLRALFLAIQTYRGYSGSARYFLAAKDSA